MSLGEALNQVTSEQVEYQSDYWAWQMETEVRDVIVAAVRRLLKARKLVAVQAEDEGLWFNAITAPEVLLQQGLRRLHALIEMEADRPVSHGEDTCQRCGGNNIWSWNVPSDRFNAAMKALGLTSVAIVCPTCFVDGHELATGMRTVWTLQPDSYFHHIGAIDEERLPRTSVEPSDPTSLPMTPREYILSVVEINKRHGMGTASPSVIEAAIEEVESITERWTHESP